jgi:GTP-binding protein
MPAEDEDAAGSSDDDFGPRNDDDWDELEGNLDYEFEDNEDLSQKPIKVAIVGRPNAGKSTLVNAILGEDRVMTGPEAGITRDPIAVDWEWQNQKFQLVDTAGLRRKSKITDRIEQMSTHETMRIVRLAQVVVLVIDGLVGLDKQDLNIASHVVSEGRILILAINKWDAVEDRAGIQKNIRKMLDTVLGQLPGVPVVYLSGLNGKGLDGLFQGIMDAYAQWNMRAGTGQLNRWLARMESKHPAPLVSGRPNRLRYMTQVKARPPTFALWCSKPNDMPDDYQRYLINGLREDVGIGGVPIRLMLRTSKNPSAN